MTKRITTMFLLLALAGGWYFMQGKADGGESKPALPTATATNAPSGESKPALPTATATNAPSGCNVQTGIEGGTVNLRTCAGTACAVLDIVTEGERLQIIAAGAWMNVTTEDGVTGYINSKYCKGK